MKRMINYTKPKFITTIFTLLMAGMLLALPQTAAAQGPTVEFWADQTQIQLGQCVAIHWDTENVQSVYYNNQPVSGVMQTRTECPTSNTTYTLLVNTRDGQQIRRQIDIQVVGNPVNWNNEQDWTNTWENWNARNNANINFWIDQTQIRAGQCVTVHWDTENVREVYYEGQGVSGIDQSRVECPNQSTTYNLLVITRDGQRVNRQIDVQVVDRPANWDDNWENWNNWDNNNNMIIDFWADRSHIRAGECVNIFWHTNNVNEVYYEGQGVSGVHQQRTECPSETTTYDLQVVTRNNLVRHQQVRIDVSGSLYDEGDLSMRTGQMVDFDDGGEVSDNEDDFRWLWINGERGSILKADDDDDLRLAVRGEGSSNSFNRLSRDDCEDYLDDHDSDEIDIDEEDIVCFRTDGGNYGKFRVTDIRSTNGRLFLDWLVWQ